jgi:hypothetical protein
MVRVWTLESRIPKRLLLPPSKYQVVPDAAGGMVPRKVTVPDASAVPKFKAASLCERGIQAESPLACVFAKRDDVAPVMKMRV